MSLHIGAEQNEIAETVLISGDPLRAKYVAEKMLTQVTCYTRVRGMLGFTGFYKDKRVSIQGTGMGIPSTAIYLHELIHDYGAKKIIRIGTCGALQPHLKLGQLILADAAYTDSNTHLNYFSSMDAAVKSSSDLLNQAKETAGLLSIPVNTGEIFSTDTFYHENTHRWESWIKNGLLGIEMESSILYTLACINKIQALSILSVSDNLITKDFSTAKEREEAGSDMMKLALEIA